MHQTLLIAFKAYILQFKSCLIKYGIITNYSDKCKIWECTTCEFINGLIIFSTLCDDALGSVFTYDTKTFS